MKVEDINDCLLNGDIDSLERLPHVVALNSSEYIFDNEFSLDILPEEPGILLIRGARQYGKSTWLEQQLLRSVKEFGAGTTFYLNGDFITDSGDLAIKLEQLSISFGKGVAVKRIFIDEITNIKDWEKVLKRLVDNGSLREVLIITTGSKATDLRRGSERLPGRKGKLNQTDYLFTPVSYKSFYEKCNHFLKEKTLISYLLSGGSPIACQELAKNNILPEYVIQLVRDWVEGEIVKAGRHRSSLINVLNVLFRFGGSGIGQAKLAREANLSNNTVAQGYIEILNDLGCVIPSYPIDSNSKSLILRKACKYHYTNLLVAVAYHPARIRTVDDFCRLSKDVQGMWYEWLIAQEIERRRASNGEVLLEPLSFWQSKTNEIDFYDPTQGFIEVKRGGCSALEFAWFASQFGGEKLTVINKNKFETDFLSGVSLEDYLLMQ